MLAAAPAFAQQLSRDVETADATLRYNLAFRDATGTAREVAFGLDRTDYAEAHAGLIRPDSAEAVRRIEAAMESRVDAARAAWREGMRTRLNAIDAGLPDGVRLYHSFVGMKLTWNLHAQGMGQDALDALSRRVKPRIAQANRRILAREQRKLDRATRKTRESVYRELHYLRDPGLDNILRVDYRGIARTAAPRLKPLAAAIGETAGSGARDRLALALALVQTIPYDRLETRDVTEGVGFATPVEMLHLNRGDCDTKATALAALLHTLAPELSVAMVLLPGHAVLAVDLPPQPGEHSVTLRGRAFVTMEPAGPAVMPLGQLGNDSAQAIAEDKVQGVVWMNG